MSAVTFFQRVKYRLFVISLVGSLISDIAFALCFVFYAFASYGIFPAVPFEYVYVSLAVLIVCFAVHKAVDPKEWAKVKGV
jgi:hypothetical protein